MNKVEQQQFGLLRFFLNNGIYASKFWPRPLNANFYRAQVKQTEECSTHETQGRRGRKRWGAVFC